ncbi:hypothetical protein C8R46DRAFT_1138315 [Mycena filopes]|nr:hypothetical protein C8R46DRAFT_1138315 [Mycena filopes]
MLSRSLLRPIRTVGTTARWQRASMSHTTNSYEKEVDSSPAADPKIHRVDPGSENVQKPHEPPSGKWSATGAEAGASSPGSTNDKNETGMDEYSTMSGDRPYAAPGAGGAQRYGGKEGYEQEKGGNPRETSQSTEGEGPQGSESGGRKPEGR